MERKAKIAKAIRIISVPPVMVTSLIGYSAAFIWAIFTDVKDSLLLICSTYFFSVVLLSISNKVIHFRASGHACSFAGPLVLLVHFYLG